MIYAALSLMSFLFGGLGRRIAGGGLNQWAGLPGGVNGRVMGDTPARFIYAGLIAACALPGVCAGHATWLVLPTLTVATWIGATTGNFDSIGMGRGGHTFARDYWGMTAHGVICAALITAALALLHFTGQMLPKHWSLAGAAFSFAPESYQLGWTVAGLRGNKHLPVGLQTGSDLAEVIWGGLCGLCMFNAFWLV